MQLVAIRAKKFFLGPIDATHHDMHHLRRKGNYGSDIGVWDRICGTTIGGTVIPK